MKINDPALYDFLDQINDGITGVAETLAYLATADEVRGTGISQSMGMMERALRVEIDKLVKLLDENMDYSDIENLSEHSNK